MIPAYAASLVHLLDLGFHTNAASTDFPSILSENFEAILNATADIYMGTEISDSVLSFSVSTDA